MINRFLRKLNLQLSRIRPIPRTEGYDGVCLNIGAGNWAHPKWINVDNPRPDYDKSLSANVAHDLMGDQSLPFADNSVSLIFTSHTVEHLNDAAVKRLFSEAYRVLKPDGVIRITCPDIALYISALLRGDRSFFIESLGGTDTPHSSEQIFLFSIAGPLSVFHKGNELPKQDDSAVRSNLENLDHFCSLIPDEIARKYPKHHKTWFTKTKLAALLSEAGFEPHESAYLQSLSPAMRERGYFDTTHPNLSLYMDGLKRRAEMRNVR